MFSRISRKSLVSKVLVVLVAATVAACGQSDGAEKGKAREAPLVKAEPATTMRFVDRIDAVGTANANEQVTVSAPVTERIVRLHFDDGDYVRQGQVLATLQQAQQTAQMREAQARLRETEQQLARIEELKDRGFATRSAYDAQVASAAAARAQAQAVGADLSERVIRAPFSGWVSLRNISVGAIATQGTEIATISDLSTIKLDFTIPETLLNAIREGAAIEARSDAYPDQPFRGRIGTIDPVVDPQTRAVTVRALLPNPDRKLRPGMLLTVMIENQPRTALSVPELSVIGEGDDRYVFVVDEAGRAQRVAVRTGVRSNGRVEIVQGLRPGQRVITEGVVKVADDMPVRLAGPQNARPAAERRAQGAAPAPAPAPARGGGAP